MGNNVVKTIVLLMVLVVLSLLVGAQVSDNVKDSFGAFALIAIVVVGFLLLLLGKNSWWLAFFLPYALANVPIPYINGQLASFAVGGMLFVYHIVQSKVMGFARMKWHSFPLLDVLLLVIFGYMCVSYYRFPVSISALGLELDYVGGAVYAHALGGFVYFLFLSFLDVKREDVEKVLRWAFFVQMLMLALNIALRLKSGDIYWGGGNQESADFSGDVGEQRITLFSVAGVALFVFIYASRPLLALMRSPVAFALSVLSVVSGALSGSRGFLVRIVLSVFAVSVLRKEILALTLVGIVAWGGLVGLGNTGAIQQLPPVLQRTLFVVPGVKISRAIAVEAQNSSDVRVFVWKQAFEPRTGYIRDYIWGDGYQTSVRVLERNQVAIARSEVSSMSDDMFAQVGLWHNGFITTMHRLGLVGCFLLYSVMLLEVALFLKVGSYYLGRPFFPYYCVFCNSCFVGIFIYSYNAATVIDFCNSLVVIALVKLLYCLLREQGLVTPLFHRRLPYVPMTIREFEQR